MFGWFRPKIDWETENYCYDLNNRVKDLKRRIAEAKLAHDNRIGKKVEPKFDIPKQVVEQPKSTAELLKEQLLGKRNKDFYKPVD